jgi:hypothetical protein
MSMNQTAAQSVIYAAINTYFPPIPSGISGPESAAIIANREALANAIAALIPYIVSNAIVNPGSMAVTPSDLISSSGGGPLSGDGVVHNGTGTLS